MLDILELEGFDKAIYSHSWLDETTGELLAWSRGEYDDFRRKHPECKLPSSIEILKYFGYSLDRFGWTTLMSKRYNLLTPERKGSDFEGGQRERNKRYGESNDDDEEGNYFFDIEDRSIVGWEEQIHLIVDNGLSSAATDELIDAMLARPALG